MGPVQAEDQRDYVRIFQTRIMSLKSVAALMKL